MSKRDGHQKGPQHHPQGGHGDKTHSKIVEQLHQNTHKKPDEANRNSDKDRPTDGKSKGRA